MTHQNIIYYADLKVNKKKRGDWKSIWKLVGIRNCSSQTKQFSDVFEVEMSYFLQIKHNNNAMMNLYSVNVEISVQLIFTKLNFYNTHLVNYI